jgi:hypothetical protein
MKISDLLLIVLLIIVVIILGKDVYRYMKSSTFLGGKSDNVHRYYVYPSEIDSEFVSQVGKILSESLINEKYTLQQVFDEKDADATIRLVAREEMERLSSEKVEYYPGTKKRIYFSWTYVYENPKRILIDATNWNGVPESGLDLDKYRKYLIRHELWHSISPRNDHIPCNEKTINEKGECPLMHQSTRGCGKYNCGYDISPIEYDYYSKKLFGIF